MAATVIPGVSVRSVATATNGPEENQKRQCQAQRETKRRGK